MLRGLHGLFYSSDAEATPAFIRDKLQLGIYLNRRSARSEQPGQAE